MTTAKTIGTAESRLDDEAAAVDIAEFGEALPHSLKRRLGAARRSG